MEIKKALATILGVSLCAGTFVGVSVEDVKAASQKPNIVVVYTDDFAPHADWLWCNRSRTPSLAKFCSQGVKFEQATAVTSLCAPARAALLTGQWGHNNSVTSNESKHFNPKETFAKRLQNQGYHTGISGKYINRLSTNASTRSEVMRFAKGWDNFNIFYTPQGKFYDYPVWTRRGILNLGKSPKDHSTRVFTKQAVEDILTAPKDQPIFEFLSIYNGHEPNQPMERFRRNSACRSVKAWSGPAYNEHDVTDKPKHIRQSAKLPGKSYDLRVRCEEMMTVDWAVGKIRAALRKTGRLDNTLLIFTSDNGWGMGDHRREGKVFSYTNPVILYAIWPKAIGNRKRIVTEPVQNIDLAPTFCEIAGCNLPKADGMSLLSLILGETDRLDRGFVYEEMLHEGGQKPGYYGLRTTKRFSEKVEWIYTEHSTKEIELYNLTEDKWQLENLADEPGYEFIGSVLSRMLHDEVIIPDNVRFRFKN